MEKIDQLDERPLPILGIAFGTLCPFDFAFQYNHSVEIIVLFRSTQGSTR